MILDEKNLFSDKQTLAIGVGTVASTNELVGGAANAAIGQDGHVPILAIITTAVASAGASTVQVHLQDSADGSTYATVLSTTTIAKATLVAGYKLPIHGMSLPRALRQYIQLLYQVAVATNTAGNITAGLTAR